jgi:hypothetical protein
VGEFCLGGARSKQDEAKQEQDKDGFYIFSKGHGSSYG